jgi:hypothetical protein
MIKEVMMAEETRKGDAAVVVRNANRNRVGVSLMPIAVVAAAILSVIALYATSQPEQPRPGARVDAPQTPPVTPPPN